MKINPINTFKISFLSDSTKKSSETNVQLPYGNRNYTLFDWNKVDSYLLQKEKALPELKKTLQTSQDEKEIVETLYIIDRMIDAGVKGIPAMYPELSKFNETESKNIQAFLAGIYRKIQVPDAFGPLVAMLIKNSMQSASTNLIKQKELADKAFDPNEEIGGAILAYIENYSKNSPKIDYSA